MNPEDFRRLATLDTALAEVAFDRITMSNAALEAHRVEDTPHAPVEDPTEIKAVLGL